MERMAWTSRGFTSAYSDSGLDAVKNHSMTLIGSKLYVFGGFTTNGNSNKMTILDLVQNTFTELHGVSEISPSPRNGHRTCTAGPGFEGKFFIHGGWTNDKLASDELWMFDTSTNDYTLIPTSYDDEEDYPSGCNLHSMDYIQPLNSLAIFKGGDGRHYFNNLYLLDLDTMTWTSLTFDPNCRFPLARASHGSCVSNGQLYIFGGWNGNNMLNDLHMIDLTKRPYRWHQVTTTTVSPSPRGGMTMVSKDDKIVVFGGHNQRSMYLDDVYMFDCKTYQWKETKNLVNSSKIKARAQVGGTGTQTPKIKSGVYSVMDANPNNMSVGELSKDVIWVFNDPPKKRQAHASVLVNRKILVYGGTSTYTGLNSSMNNNKEVILNDVFELDLNPPPPVIISAPNITNQFGVKLRQYLPSSQSRTLSDITFRIDGRELYAHKIVLCLGSQRFKAMFHQGFKETGDNVIDIDDCSYEAFAALLDYLYTGEPPAVFTDLLSKAQPRLEVMVSLEEFVSQETDLASEKRQIELIQTSDESKWKDKTSVEFDEDEVKAINIVIELLALSDTYLLENLKQLCEMTLVQVIHYDLVDLLLDQATLANANQLKAACIHFKNTTSSDKPE